jgi:hypothetical protein|tara:strand:+ start:76 stop:543 length:468 start_codon:yes stop_codon:yes gene_type:complete
MTETCIVCDKKIYFSLFTTFPVELETGETKKIHHDCRNRYFNNPEEFGGPLSAQLATVTSSSAQSATVTSSPTHNINKTTKPSIIELLSTLGWVLFALTGLSGLFLLNQDGGGILGVSLIIAGFFQLSIFLGFSAIIDQLYKINVNTTKPHKSDT